MIETQELESLCNSFISKSYVSQGVQELRSCAKDVKTLLSQREMPQRGWSEAMIERLLSDLALMDSNSFRGNAGVGEREGRIACPMVARRNHHLSHGIGRSGDIAAEQPKVLTTELQAAGSSLLTRVAHCLVLHALRLAGMHEMAVVQVFPVATGMAMTLAFLACAAKRPGARYVVWSRIDQKTCLKSIIAANLVPEVVPLVKNGDQLETDVEAMQQRIVDLGASNVACVVTTTSCFAPRACDNLSMYYNAGRRQLTAAPCVKIEAASRMCQSHEIPHVVNNAYGVQSAWICSQVTRAVRVGRLDVMIQSTDKNFLVPVGGAIAAAPKGQEGGVLREMASRYPGRAGVSAHLDLLITLLHLGQQGWLKLLQEREELFDYCKLKLGELAEQLGERLLHGPRNPISMALTVDSFPTLLVRKQQLASCNKQDDSVGAELHALQRDTNIKACNTAEEACMGQKHVTEGAETAASSSGIEARTSMGQHHTKTGGVKGSSSVAQSTSKIVSQASSATLLGAMLWQRHVSGVRVVCRGKRQAVSGIEFEGYGSSFDNYPHDYMTAAAALGASKEDVDVYVEKIKKCWISEVQ